MSDLIDRQAAIDAMETWDKFGCDPDGKLVRYDDDKHYIPYVHYEDMVHAIKHLPSAQRWIPCSERLPEVGKDVMVCYDFKGHRSVLIGVLYGDEKFHGYDDEYLTPEGRKYRKAVAWMPLPEPYKSESEG